MTRNSTGANAIVILLVVGNVALAQGTISFVNLDFEHPILPLTPGPVSLSNAFPGWSASTAGFIGYDDVSLGAAAITLHDTNGFIQVLQGSYTAVLQRSYPDGTLVPALGQIGTVPVAARSITFYADGAFTLSFAGAPVPLVALATNPNYVVIGGDISGFQGQTGELKIEGAGSVDNILFSSQPLPEPGTATLWVAGCCYLLHGFHRSRSRREPWPRDSAQACAPSGFTNIAGYMTLGAHSSLFGHYARVSSKVQWGDGNGWYIIMTIESFNGWREPVQGNFTQWFSSIAFGGTNYSNTPVGAATHTDEPLMKTQITKLVASPSARSDSCLRVPALWCFMGMAPTTSASLDRASRFSLWVPDRIIRFSGATFRPLPGSQVSSSLAERACSTVFPSPPSRSPSHHYLVSQPSGRSA